MTTPLDQFPEFAAAYKHVPEPALVWNFASIDDAYKKMSSWNFFLYALVTYAHSMTAKIERKSESAIDVGVKTAAAKVKAEQTFTEVKKNTEDVAKILKKNRPIQDPYFMKTVLLRQNKEMKSNLQNLLHQAEPAIAAYFGFFPLAKTLFDQTNQLVESFSKSTKVHSEGIANADKGYDALFREDAASLQAQMASVAKLEDFQRRYFPQSIAEEAVGGELIQLSQQLVNELWNHRTDQQSIQLVLQVARSHFG